MSRIIFIAVAAACLSVGLGAQENRPAQQPEVRVNYLNVCAPTDAEASEIGAALGLLPVRPAFGEDFEVARGRSTMSDQPAALNSATIVGQAPVSKWVRLRREYTQGSSFSNVQYSFSMDEQGMTETLAFHVRQLPKSDMLQLSIQDTVTSGTPQAVVASNTPANRIRVERSGRSSLVLARCEGADQGKYAPLFRTASEIMAKYRSLLRVQGTVPADLARLNVVAGEPPKRPAAKAVAPKKQ